MTENQQPGRPDPAWDPKVRWQVQRALNQVIRAAADVVMRHASKQYGDYVPPPEVDELGDVTGLIRAGNNEVLRPLQEAIDAAREVMRATYAQVDEFKAHPNYRPPSRDL